MMRRFNSTMAYCIWPVFLVFAMLLSACSEVPPRNPYDPQTPIAQQARALVSGTLLLPEGFSDSSLFTGVQLSLIPQSSLSESRLFSSVSADGAFAFENVPAGAYRLGGTVVGMKDVSSDILVERGADLPLRPYQLVVDVPTERAESQWIEGTVLLEDAAAMGHAGALIETEGRPFQAQTTSQGLFRLDVPAGTYTLRISADGYGTQTYPDVVVNGGEATAIDEILLPIVPGSITGRTLVMAPQGQEAAPKANVTASIYDSGELLRSVVSNAEGRFVLDGLRAGVYALAIGGGEELTESRELIEVRAGVAIDIGDRTIDLRRGELTGRVQPMGGQAEVITVRVTRPEGHPESDLLWTATTLDGTYRIAGLPSGPYSVFTTAPGFVNVDADFEVDLAPGERRTAPDIQLPVRTYAIDAPAAVQEQAVLRITRDPDMLHARIWMDDAERPDTHIDLSGPERDRLSVRLDGDGRHSVHIQLLNSAAIDDDPNNEYRAETSPTFTVNIIADTEGPRLLRAELAEGLPVVQSHLNIPLTTNCLDAQTPEDRLGLSVIASDGEVLYSGAYMPLVFLNLTPGQGERSVVVQCEDQVSLQSEPTTVAVVVDQTPPAVTSVRLNGGGENEPAGSRIVSVAITATDVHSEVRSLAISDTDGACADQIYQYPSDGPATFTFSDAQGPRRLYVCAKDAAGNVSESAVVSNALIIDTTPPAMGAIRLGTGPQTNTRSVNLALDNAEESGFVHLSGDLVESGRYALNNVPPQVELTDGDAPKVVTAWYEDAAGNTSAPFSTTITLDTRPPNTGQVMVANDQLVVNEQVVSVLITDTAPDRMSIWEVAAEDTCGARTCDDAGYRAFAPASNFTLSPALEQKRICWQFCDQAGNQSTPPGSRLIRLDTHIPRPVPTLIGMVPRNHLSFSQDNVEDGYLVTISGRGFAHDTRARVGAFVLPCAPSTPANDCRTDAQGGCGENGQCAATCATQCTFNLSPQIVANAGTYPVRLETPVPVADGLGLSAEVMFLDVVAPVPTIESISVRGLVQAVENDVPVGQQFEAQITGRNFTDNVQFRLGANFGQVIEIGPNDPMRRRTARVLLSTDGLMPSDLVDAEVVAVNPTPGGGVSGVISFGLNPVVSVCQAELNVDDESAFSHACLTNLRTTRAPLPSGHGRAQQLRFTAPFASGTSASHGDALGLRDNTGGLIARTTAADGPMRLPKLLGQDDAVQIEDHLGRTPNVRIGLAPRRGVGAFKPYPVGQNNLATVSDFTMGDWDRDGLLDVAVTDFIQNSVVLLDSNGQERGSYPQDCQPKHIEASDLNGDGWLDLVISCVGDQSYYTVWLGSGGFNFEEAPQLDVPFIQNGIADLVVADFNGDHLPDLAYTTESSPYLTAIDLGRGDGTFSRLGQWILSGELDRLKAGDLNGDGVPDLFGAWNDQRTGTDWARALINRGDGVFQDGQYDGIGPALELPAGSEIANSGLVDIALGDLNFDGAQDAVVSAQRADHLVVLLGHGDGEFSVAERFAVGTPVDQVCGQNSCGPSRLQLADLNGDGLLDAMVNGTSRSDARIASYLKLALGRGDGRFGAFERVATPEGSRGLGLADVNNDGLTDALTIDGNGHLEIWRGSDHSEFGVENCQTALLCAFNCEDDECRAACKNRSDIKGTRLYERVFECMRDERARGNLCLGSHQAYNEGPWMDNLRDCALDCPLEFNECGMDIHREPVARRMTLTGSRVIIPGQVARHRVDNVMLADLDDDGRLDAIIQSNDATITLHFAQEDGTFSSPTAADVAENGVHVLNGGQFASVRLVDLDGDGVEDFYGFRLGGALRWARGLGGGQFAPFAEVGHLGPINARRSIMHFPDLNGDGLKDRLFAFQDGGFGAPRRIGHALGNGDGTFGEMTSLDIATNYFALFDVNGDDRADIVSIGADEVGLRVAITTPDGQLGDWQPFWNEPVFRYLPYDYNRDGLMDLFVQRQGEEEVRVIRQTDDHEYVVDATYSFDGLGLGDALGDLNGDGLVDMVEPIDDFTLQIRYGHPDTGFARDTQDVALPQGGVWPVRYSGDWVVTPSSVQVTDVDQDGVDDIVLPSSADASVHIVRPPAPSWWGQVLTDMPQASLPLQAGSNEMSVHQASQFISKLGVRVRIEGSTLDGVSVRLRAPDGRVIELDDGVSWAEEAIWQAHYPTSPTTCALASLYGWQPRGEWTLIVDADADVQAALTDFAVITHGTFTRPTGDACSNAIPYTIGESVWGSTVGAPSLHASNCAGRSRSEEAVFSFVADGDGAVCLNTNGSTYDTAMHVREVECDDQERQIACNDDGGFGSQSQVELNVVAGTRYFIFVDGFSTFNQGEFVLNSAPGPCADFAPAAPSICP